MATTRFTRVSSNAKTGPIPVSYTERASCPTTCPFYDKGCYAKYGPVGMQWKEVAEGEKVARTWDQLCGEVHKLPYGQLWRHNVAGDLPHNNGEIDGVQLNQLVNANKGRRGFTYSHHLLSEGNASLIRQSNARGFTINASCESVEQADTVMTEQGIPAVAVVSSEESRRFFRTKGGRKVIVCPATIHDSVTCATCGLCANAERETIVAFPAHGTAKKTVNEKVAQR